MDAAQIECVEQGNGLRVAVDGLERVLGEALPPLPVRLAPLAESFGATLAEPLITTTALPVADTAAMDGFAVSGPGPQWTLRMGACVAGRRPRTALAGGDAVRIATGAQTPRGATAVLRNEYVVTERVGARWMITHAPDAPYRNDIRGRGEYWSGGAELACAGTRVDAALVSAALSAEAPVASVRGPLHADVLITGDEIRSAGALGAGQARDALGPVLPEYLRACDIRCREVWRLADDRALLRAWFALETDAELVVTVGGTGYGAADLLRPVLAEIGASIIVDGVRMRPGGSQLVARLPDGRTLLALPGNPLAAVSALLLTGRLLADRLAARRPRAPRWGRLADAAAPGADFTRVVPVRQVEGGVWRAGGAVHTPHLANLIEAQALALLPPGTGRGALVELLPLPW
ncbi:molybdopterin-binding protein [Nocardia sp. NPDC058058]|uniref:molybdopterin-binding protein n=1 Tax=Nocardia sp. NPDC058058 TaxID=3346317 RepID=UPI0036D8F94F